MIRESEKSTLEAINDLKNSGKPFAAGMLCYVMIERCLKIYLLDNRSALTKSDIDFDAKVGKNKLSFSQYQNSNRDDFILDYIPILTLGALEIVFRIQHKKNADHRNELIHSGIYIVCQSGEPTEKRQKDNYKELEIAINNLMFLSNHCFKEPIEYNQSGNLVFKS